MGYPRGGTLGSRVPRPPAQAGPRLGSYCWLGCGSVAEAPAGPPGPSGLGSSPGGRGSTGVVVLRPTWRPPGAPSQPWVGCSSGDCALLVPFSGGPGLRGGGSSETKGLSVWAAQCFWLKGLASWCLRQKGLLPGLMWQESTLTSCPPSAVLKAFTKHLGWKEMGENFF